VWTHDLAVKNRWKKRETTRSHASRPEQRLGYGILFHTQGIKYKYPIYIKNETKTRFSSAFFSNPAGQPPSARVLPVAPCARWPRLPTVPPPPAPAHTLHNPKPKPLPSLSNPWRRRRRPHPPISHPSATGRRVRERGSGAAGRCQGRATADAWRPPLTPGDHRCRALSLASPLLSSTPLPDRRQRRRGMGDTFDASQEPQAFSSPWIDTAAKSTPCAPLWVSPGRRRRQIEDISSRRTPEPVASPPRRLISPAAHRPCRLLSPLLQPPLHLPKP
jgi:hypothetical protein